MHEALGLRQRQKIERRQLLIDAAHALFLSEKGFDGTTVDEIAARAGVSRRSFFRYFPTKEAVVFHDSDHRLALLAELLEAAPGQGLEAVLEACVGMARHYAQARDEVIEQYRLIESSPALVRREAEINRAWVALLARELEAHGAAPRRSRILAGAIFGGMQAVLAEWLASGGRLDLVELSRDAMGIFTGKD